MKILAEIPQQNLRPGRLVAVAYAASSLIIRQSATSSSLPSPASSDMAENASLNPLIGHPFSELETRRLNQLVRIRLPWSIQEWKQLEAEFHSFPGVDERTYRSLRSKFERMSLSAPLTGTAGPSDDVRAARISRGMMYEMQECASADDAKYYIAGGYVDGMINLPVDVAERVRDGLRTSEADERFFNEYVAEIPEIEARTLHMRRIPAGENATMEEVGDPQDRMPYVNLITEDRVQRQKFREELEAFRDEFCSTVVEFGANLQRQRAVDQMEQSRNVAANQLMQDELQEVHRHLANLSNLVATLARDVRMGGRSGSP